MKRRFSLSAFLIASLITALPVSGEIIDGILVIVDNSFIIKMYAIPFQVIKAGVSPNMIAATCVW